MEIGREMTPAETALTPQLIMHHRFVIDEVLTKISILREESIHTRS
ncbi:hypothetical protein [Brevibacterium linens]